MPKDEKYWNPYRLIPVREEIEKRPPITHEKFKGKCGAIHCTLKNLTPLFVGMNRNNNQQFLTRKGEEVIPGSSLKGMLRSLAEIVGGGCNITDPGGKYNKKYAACNKAHSLCITCRIFGMMERGKGARIHTGNINISDALVNMHDAFLRDEKPKPKTFKVLLSNSGTRHEPFYRSPHTGKLDGKSRKFYFHQPKRKESVPMLPENLQQRAQEIRGLPPGYQFDFEIQFSNLKQDELELIIYALALEEYVEVKLETENITLKGPMRHKIGHAKPLGMGSCEININQLIYYPPPSVRLATLQETDTIVYKGDELKDEIAKLTRNIVGDSSVTMTQLRKMMVWDENDTREFKYPDFNWFRDKDNSQKILKAI